MVLNIYGDPYTGKKNLSIDAMDIENFIPTRKEYGTQHSGVVIYSAYPERIIYKHELEECISFIELCNSNSIDTSVPWYKLSIDSLEELLASANITSYCYPNFAFFSVYSSWDITKVRQALNEKLYIERDIVKEEQWTNGMYLESFITSKRTVIRDLKIEQLNDYLTIPKEPIKPTHKFERIWQQKMMPSFTPYIEYVDGKSYYEYPEDSFVRTNWRQIDDNHRTFPEKIREYKSNLVVYKNNLKTIKKWRIELFEEYIRINNICHGET